MEHLVNQISRRKFILTAGAAGMGGFLLKGCASSPNSGSQLAPMKAANASGGNETTKARIGFIGQTDASPLVVAKVKKIFEKYGMPDVELVKQPSWGVTRDNLQIGSAGGGLDGAMVLSPMPYHMSMGTITVNNKKLPMYVVARLNTGGQGISVGNRYRDANVTLDASKIKERVDRERASGNYLRFAHTFKGGNSDLMLRYWLAAGGIDPDQDVNLMTIPPAQMVVDLKAGTIDGYCVGEPWNYRAARDGHGFTIASDLGIWNGHPGKVLGVREDWANAYPNTHIALVKALVEACQYCADPQNVQEIRQLLSQREYLGMKADYITLADPINDLGTHDPHQEYAHPQFFGNGVNRPSRTEQLWIITQMARWGITPFPRNWVEILERVCRTGTFSTAARELGLDVDYSRSAIELFDGVKFSAEDPIGYLNSLKIKRPISVAEVILQR